MERFSGLALIAAAVLAAGAPSALAEGAGGHGERMLQRLDLNRDGTITAVEAGAVQTVRFLRLDGNGDGVITEAEMVAAAQARIARRIAKKFARMDRNGDGRVERAEFDDRGAERFARLDADGDGRVSSEEIRTRPLGQRRGRHDDRRPDD
ncbi:MAG: EF-hand domain-containing protein [Paracoccaceae bacterium]